MIEDITKLKHAHENLERLASYDTLTGLPDRRMFRERLEHAVSLLNRHTQRLALLYLDLDNFKRVNDSLGHDIGDILLSKVAQRLTDCVRRDDTVARLGGDEFVILLQGVSEGFNVDALAHKILQQVKDPVMAEGIETRAQMDFLQARGCDFGQGYLFGRPVPPSRYLSELLIVQLPA